MLRTSLLTDAGSGLLAERAASLRHLAARAADRVLQLVAGRGNQHPVASPALPGLDHRLDLEVVRVPWSASASLASGAFDAVVLHEVLEHVDDPCACLR